MFFYERSSLSDSEASLPSYQSNEVVTSPRNALYRNGLGALAKNANDTAMNRGSPPTSQSRHNDNVAHIACNRPHSDEDVPGGWYLAIGVLTTAIFIAAVVTIGVSEPTATKDCPALPDLPSEKQTRYVCNAAAFVGYATVAMIIAKLVHHGSTMIFHVAIGDYFDRSEEVRQQARIKFAGSIKFVRYIVPVLAILVGALVFSALPWKHRCFVGCVSDEEYPPYNWL